MARIDRIPCRWKPLASSLLNALRHDGNTSPRCAEDSVTATTRRAQNGRAWAGVLWIGVLSGGLYAAVAVSQRAIQIDPRHGVLGSVPLRLGVYLVATVGLFALYV